MKFVHLFLLVSYLFPAMASAQPLTPSTANAHSHNDYLRAQPFQDAWSAGFGSIEADVFFVNRELFVAHTLKEIDSSRTLRSLYLDPIRHALQKNGGRIYKDSSRHLQLMIDFKTEGDATMRELIRQLEQYPDITGSSSVKLVISGNRPDPASWSALPSFIWFDGEFGRSYTANQLARIEMMSDNFARYSKWNGKGRLPKQEKQAFDSLIDAGHKAGKKVRFWNAPDLLNSWYAYIDQGVDFVNTDNIEAITEFFGQLADRSYLSTETYVPYKPTYRNDATTKPIKNVIILIGDGTGLPQWYAGYTANHGALNVFNMINTGLSKTSSYDNYITDSAPGATAISSGEKTNNRAVGIDHTGRRLDLLPTILRKKKRIKTGIITSGDLRDATPASFYAHRPERSDNTGIISDLLQEPVDIIMGACHGFGKDSLLTAVKRQFAFYQSVADVQMGSKPIFVADSVAAKHMYDGRGDWAAQSFDKSISILSKNKDGFLLMLEGAQIDHACHANKLPWAITELLDFDKIVGKAMQFADTNGETLVIVTADHETGGLTLTGGDYSKGLVRAQFSTGDHTALPVPVFAYGPGSQYFTGVYENTEIFNKILRAMKIR